MMKKRILALVVLALAVVGLSGPALSGWSMFCPLDSTGKVAIAYLPTGSTSSTVTIGNDSRLSDSRTPTAHASTHVSTGSDPIANVVAAGASGLMSGADKTKLDGVSGSNTGDETTSTIKTKLGITTLSGSNTGDETAATIESKLSVSAGNVTALASLSGTNTGDETLSTIKTKLGITTLSGSNTGDQTISCTGDVTATGSTGALSTTVTKINGVSLAGLATGILKNTTTTGVPSIAVSGTDFKTINSTSILGSGDIVVGGGSTPTGTGYRHVTSGTEDGAAKTPTQVQADLLVQPRGYTTTAMTGTTTTLTNASTRLQVFTGSASSVQTVVLPDATTIPFVDWEYEFDNNTSGTGALTIQANGGTTLWVAGPGGGAHISLLTKSIAAGTWDVDAYNPNPTSGKVLNVSNSLTLAGTDGTTMTFPSISAALAPLANPTFSGNVILSGTQAQTNLLYENARVFRPGDYAPGNTYDPGGSSDSTSSFTAMMTAFNAYANRSVIEIPAGTFKLNTGVLTGFSSAAPITIRGQGRETTVLIPNGATGDMIHLTSGMDGVTISDLAIYQTGSPSTAGCGINTNGANDVNISRVFFVGQFDDVCVQGSSIKVNIQETRHSETNGSATSVGILVSNGAAGDTYIGPDVVMSNTGATRRRASVEVTQSGHYEINQANLTGAQYGILIDPPAGQIVAFGFHNEVLADSCSVNGMLMNAASSTSTIKNIKSTTSWYSGTISGGGAGVLTQGVAGGIIDGITFTNDRFLNNQTHGFQHGFGTDFRWDLCDMKGNSSAGANANDGLNIAAGVSNWAVVGGKYGGTDAAATGGNQRYGINIASGASSNVGIDGPDLSGNTSGPLNNGSTVPILVTNIVGGANGLKTTANAATVTTTTEVIVAQLPIPANSLKVGSVFRVSTSYHPAATTIITGRLRVGSAGTTSDAAVVTCYATAATNAGTRYAECISGVQAIGASATHLGAGQEEVGAIGASGVQAATSGTFNSAVANYVSFSLQNTSSTTTTVYAAALEILSN